ncbi:carboxymuconolactone decarboxylase family protein [Bacteriovorax sp. PP10]|uniref:Carboxymuconolactone decarboxylase family protein n=1 Tax=Bacteriovorax antarcticus TaxID=3088717 RepID=A0ABU5VZC7_9BACT|nr:carboxymuconolactone decarboxylase family protein [Bacteriovorax sp. PP10]MEA9358434.1 carboxymuconolactone decarboxylase family protein [Bacteriovorax sp. PP10]
MLNWNEYLAQIKARIGKISKSNPDVIKGYMSLVNAKTENSKLDPKTKELIALAVAITTRCDGCIVSHVDAAKKHGATQEEVMEALSVAIAVNTGAALIYTARTMDAFEALK